MLFGSGVVSDSLDNTVERPCLCLVVLVLVAAGITMTKAALRGFDLS